jgi:hypothetical protein
MKKSPTLLIRGGLLILIGFFLTGCTAISKIQKDKREATAQRKANYAALKNDIAENTLRKGTPLEALKMKYGAPDDIFYSGSSVSSFQVWTYNVYKDKLADTKLDAVILYIENDKLVNWKY